MTKRFEHDLYERDDDLAHCKVCGGAEGSLPTLCPMRPMTSFESDSVYAGQLDFSHSAMSVPVWWVPKPTEGVVGPIDFTILWDFADKHRLSYNELCAAVNRAVGKIHDRKERSVK